MAVLGDADPDPRRHEEAWERLLGLERQVRELRQLLLDGAAGSSDGPTDCEHAIESQPTRLRARATPLSDWQATCLGVFRLRCGGRQIAPCSSRRGWGILQFLLVRSEHVAARDVLIEEFWPGADPTNGAHRLQMAIHALRRSLRGCGPGGGDDAIVFRDGQYSLNAALTIDLDVERFRATCERGRRLAETAQAEAARRTLEEALTLYGGPFLSGGGQDEWAESQRVSLQDLRLGALGRLSEIYRMQAVWEQAVRCCREILVVDPYREDTIRQLLTCLAATGRLAEVERTYRACRERLWRDLQVEPAPETTRLYHQLTLAPLRQSALTGA